MVDTTDKGATAFALEDGEGVPIDAAYMSGNSLIGLGAAVEWIASRGMEVPDHEVEGRTSEATQALIKVLAKHELARGRTVVFGTPSSDPDQPLGPLPFPVWSQTSTDVDDHSAGKYVLVLLDDEFELGGRLYVRGGGWTRLRIDSSFVLGLWKPGTLETDPDRQDAHSGRRPPRGYSSASVIRLIESIVKNCPVQISPLTHDEMLSLVRDIMGNASREFVREEYRRLVPSLKQGPRRPRDPELKTVLAEFRRKMKTAELQNLPA